MSPFKDQERDFSMSHMPGKCVVLERHAEIFFQKYELHVIKCYEKESLDVVLALEDLCENSLHVVHESDNSRQNCELREAIPKESQMCALFRAIATFRIIISICQMWTQKSGKSGQQDNPP
jgi:hypothetical protein